MPDNHPDTIVWAEIPTGDMAKSIAFYNAVFGYDITINNDGPNPIAFFPSAASADSPKTNGHIYPGKPASGGNGPTLHFGVADTVEDAMGRCKAAGGQVISPVIDIPPGRFAYALDLDGNSIAFFEAKG